MSKEAKRQAQVKSLLGISGRLDGLLRATGRCWRVFRMAGQDPCTLSEGQSGCGRGVGAENQRGWGRLVRG